MVHGHKPAAYFITGNGEGLKFEGEQRQCIHCQYNWDYVPGSGQKRGYCLRCDGFLCGRPECFHEQRKFIQYMKDRYNQTRTCVPFEEWNSRLRERLEAHGAFSPDLRLTESGLFVPVQE